MRLPTQQQSVRWHLRRRLRRCRQRPPVLLRTVPAPRQRHPQHLQRSPPPPRRSHQHPRQTGTLHQHQRPRVVMPQQQRPRSLRQALVPQLRLHLVLLLPAHLVRGDAAALDGVIDRAGFMASLPRGKSQGPGALRHECGFNPLHILTWEPVREASCLRMLLCCLASFLDAWSARRCLASRTWRQGCFHSCDLHSGIIHLIIRWSGTIHYPSGYLQHACHTTRSSIRACTGA